MDKETLSNFISKCGKHDFEIACRIVLCKGLKYDAINVDGSNDGGTDFAVVDKEGMRKKVAYQITTQKSAIKDKAYNDASKSISKLGVKRFFFLCTYNLSEIEARVLENLISDELEITASVYSPSIISGILINNNLVREFLNRIGYDDLTKYETAGTNYKEIALHNYAFLSKDAKNLKDQVYDDALLLVLSNNQIGLDRETTVKSVIDLLCLPESRFDFLNRRIDSLLSKGLLHYDNTKELVQISDEVKEDILNRKALYVMELSDLAASQVDILKDYNIEWTIEDSKLVSIWIANIYMYDQIRVLEEANAPLADNFTRVIDSSGRNKLRKYLWKNKGAKRDELEEIVDKMIDNAASQPLITKITSATVYLALEGGNPLTSCRALGVNDWHTMNMILEPTLGIPYLCSLLYKGKVNSFFDNAILAVYKCLDLGIKISIPFYYIKECAGHLHMARKFNDLILDPKEMVYSSNAFVSNYNALKLAGIPVPESFIDYLATFSPAIRTERTDYKEWIRDIMTSLSSLFIRNHIGFLEMPLYNDEELKNVELGYDIYLKGFEKSKSPHLMKNDVFSLTHLNRCTQKGESWMMLTYDKKMINVANDYCSAWINNPYVFLNLTEMSKELSDMQLFSVVHSLASSSSKALTIGARILDRIILYASEKMQNWEFVKLINEFKKETINAINTDDSNFMDVVDDKTNAFLKENGISIDYDNEQNDVDM